MVRLIFIFLFIVNISVAQEGTYRFLQSKDKSQKNYVLKVVDMTDGYKRYYIVVLLSGRYKEDDVVRGGLKAELFLHDPLTDTYKVKWRMAKRWITEEGYVRFNEDFTILSTYFKDKKLNAKYKIVPYIKVLSPRSNLH